VLTTVVFDVGETLVDETPSWAAWAQWMGIPAFTLAATIGGLVARGVDHREAVPLLLPGRTFEGERDARNAAVGAWPQPLLYADALPCLRALRADGWRLVVGGNQPLAFQRLVQALELPVDVVTSSGELGVEKPSPEFYRRIAERAGSTPEQCVHVGDRVDNDVVAARAAGMAVVHLRRGPWGVLQDDPAARGDAPQLDGLAALPELLRSLRG
jgi:HAD superfamily hydrolase (TIGR01509 family)